MKRTLRLLKDARRYVDDDRCGIIGYGCRIPVVRKFERTGKLPPIRELDRAMRPLFRRQCRLIERLDAEIHALESAS